MVIHLIDYKNNIHYIIIVQSKRVFINSITYQSNNVLHEIEIPCRLGCHDILQVWANLRTKYKYDQ